MHRESLKVIQYLLERVLSEFYGSLDVAERQTPPNAGILDELGSGVAGLLQVMSRAALPPALPAPSPKEILAEGWLNLVVDELLRFNQHGLGVLCSCSEALLKAHGIMNMWHAAPGQRQPIFYRGEHVWRKHSEGAVFDRIYAKPNSSRYQRSRR